MISDTIYVVL